jgi:hypothetical protein
VRYCSLCAISLYLPVAIEEGDCTPEEREGNVNVMPTVIKAIRRSGPVSFERALTCHFRSLSPRQPLIISTDISGCDAVLIQMVFAARRTHWTATAHGKFLRAPATSGG